MKVMKQAWVVFGKGRGHMGLIGWGGGEGDVFKHLPTNSKLSSLFPD